MKIPLEHYVSGEALYTKMVSPLCDKYGLTYHEFTVLMLLANNPQYQTATQIVQARRLTKSHVSMSVRTLQERGLLVGTHRNGDRRTIYLEVTDEAWPVVQEGRTVQAAFHEALFEGFSPEEEAKISDYMARVDRNIEAHLARLRKEKESYNGAE